ncbi:MAG: hypothetical protein HYZ11_18195 [Candidatus Tectomicrobia bacterium]|uniref:Alginate export domain-containing protein n=1 Tax=Tectimicrobiota bacterium TaxID=2528274 RepID=A0A932I3R9_UNCTE|nr:hypothetical protein [Candidatus Tectomicrobia bacterium]
MQMRRIAASLAGAMLAALLLAPQAGAADFKYTGLFRIRGITTEDLDRNENTHDGIQAYDTTIRPRFTATSEGGRIFAIYELDYNDGSQGGANNIFGGNNADENVGINRWVIDFAVPGTTLRTRIGRTDYTSPDTEIFDSPGIHRQDGIALYGRLFGPVSLSAFTTKINEGFQAASDADNYYIALKWQAAPQIAITPWVGLSRQNANNATATTGYEMYYLALHGQAKIGILDVDITGIYETGDAAQPTSAARAAGARDIDIEAYGLLLRSWLTFGKAKVGFNFTYLSGDDDTIVSGSGSTAQQPDRELSRFVFPASSGWLEGPSIFTGRETSIYPARTAGGGVTNNLSTRTGVGVAPNTPGIASGDPRVPNGLIMPEVRVLYQATPVLRLDGRVAFIRSAERATSVAGTNFVSDKDFGTAIEVGFKWDIYKQLYLQTWASYVVAGDYGQTRGGPDKDDSWGLVYELRHTW